MEIKTRDDLSQRASDFLFSLKKMQIDNSQLFRSNVQIPVSLWGKTPVEKLHDKWFFETLFRIATIYMVKTADKCKQIAGSNNETCFLTFNEIDFIRKELSGDQKCA